MSPVRRFLALTPGNPMNPATLLVLGFFAVILVGFPILMSVSGLDGGGIALVMAVVAFTGICCMAFIVWMARRYARDYERLVSGEHWVHWRTTPNERAGFVARERTRAQGDARRYGLYSLIVVAVGTGLMWWYTHTLEGAAIGFGVLAVAGVIVVLTTWFWGGARQRDDASNLDDIYLGDLGIYSLGRYTPVKAFNLFLTRAEYLDEQPPALLFRIGSRSEHGVVRENDVRVLVPVGREEEGREIAARFRRHFDLKSP